jgi:hypothetical protein
MRLQSRIQVKTEVRSGRVEALEVTVIQNSGF